MPLLSAWQPPVCQAVGMFPAPSRLGAWLARACSWPLSINCTPYHVQCSQAGILCLDNLYTHHHLTHHLFILKIPQIQAFGLCCKLCALPTSSTWTFFIWLGQFFMVLNYVFFTSKERPIYWCHNRTFETSVPWLNSYNVDVNATSLALMSRQ